MTTMNGNPAQWSHLPLRDRIFMGSTFLPVDQPVRSALLLEEVARERQAALAVIAMKLRARARDLHLDEVELRSCSAAPSTGMILLTNTDDSPFGLERSIVREYSHQVLYNVTELSPLLSDSGNAEPGRRADFHELFGSIALALYFERVRYRPKRHQRQIAQRLRTLTANLLAALATFDAADLSPRGQQLVTQLAAQVARIAARQGLSKQPAAHTRAEPR